MFTLSFLKADHSIVSGLNMETDSTCTSRLLVYNRTGAASGAWVEGARYGAVYGAMTVIVLGFGTLML